MKQIITFFFIVVLSGLMTSCGLHRKVMSQDIQADSQIQLWDSTALTSKIETMVKEALTESLKKVVSQDIDIERTIYAAPDRNGRQAIAETQNIHMKSRTEENRILAVESTSDITESKDSIALSASVEDLEMEAITDIQEKTGLPWWQKTLMMLGAAVLLLLLIKIVLKFV